MDTEYDDVDYLNMSRCSGNEVCQHPVIKVTNFKSPISEINKRETVFFVGSMHGNEIIGTNVLTYLVELFSKVRAGESLGNSDYLDTKNDQEIDSAVWRTLNSKVLLIIPMANPYGYAHKERVSFIQLI